MATDKVGERKVEGGGTVKLDLVQGVEGVAVYLNDFRLAGPKPWGGGGTLCSWTVKLEDIKEALRNCV